MIEPTARSAPLMVTAVPRSRHAWSVERGSRRPDQLLGMAQEPPMRGPTQTFVQASGTRARAMDDDGLAECVRVSRAGPPQPDTSSATRAMRAAARGIDPEIGRPRAD